MTRVVGIVQARMRSTRLPGKVLLPLAHKPALTQLLHRVQAASRLHDVAVATSTHPADDPIVKTCMTLGVPVVRGPEQDVLARFHQASLALAADVVVRLTADDPMKDPAIIDETVSLLLQHGADVATTSFPPTFPEGMDVEAFTHRALETACALSEDPFEREHVTQYFYRRPQQFHITPLTSPENLSGMRLTVDTPADYALACAVYEALYSPTRHFTMAELVALLRGNPALAALNKGAQRSAMYCAGAPGVPHGS